LGLWDSEYSSASPHYLGVLPLSPSLPTPLLSSLSYCFSKKEAEDRRIGEYEREGGKEQP